MSKLQVTLCAEAAVHLREMKDGLISISNDLLDNAAELSPQQSEKLRLERFVKIAKFRVHFFLFSRYFFCCIIYSMKYLSNLVLSLSLCE